MTQLGRISCNWVLHLLEIKIINSKIVFSCRFYGQFISMDHSWIYNIEDVLKWLWPTEITLQSYPYRIRSTQHREPNIAEPLGYTYKFIKILCHVEFHLHKPIQNAGKLRITASTWKSLKDKPHSLPYMQTEPIMYIFIQAYVNVIIPVIPFIFSTNIPTEASEARNIMWEITEFFRRTRKLRYRLSA